MAELMCRDTAREKIVNRTKYQVWKMTCSVLEKTCVCHFFSTRQLDIVCCLFVGCMFFSHEHVCERYLFTLLHAGVKENCSLFYMWVWKRTVCALLHVGVKENSSHFYMWVWKRTVHTLLHAGVKGTVHALLHVDVKELFTLWCERTVHTLFDKLFFKWDFVWITDDRHCRHLHF